MSGVLQAKEKDQIGAKRLKFGVHAHPHPTDLPNMFAHILLDATADRAHQYRFQKPNHDALTCFKPQNMMRLVFPFAELRCYAVILWVKTMHAMLSRMSNRTECDDSSIQSEHG